MLLVIHSNFLFVLQFFKVNKKVSHASFLEMLTITHTVHQHVNTCMCSPAMVKLTAFNLNTSLSGIMWAVKSKRLRGDVCYFCDKHCKYMHSHMVPNKVLKCLCDWKAEEDTKGQWEEQTKYMFMTVFEGGKKVSAFSCRRKFLCETCEDLFRHIDKVASVYWENMSENWQKNCTVFFIL